MKIEARQIHIVLHFYNAIERLNTSVSIPHFTNHKINKAMDVDDSKHSQDSDVEVEGEGL